MTDDRSRRGFLKAATAALGGTWLASHGAVVMAAAEVAVGAMEQDAGWKHLSLAEADGLAAVADQIWPPDETPGAAAIGAVYFMDAAFGGFMAGALPQIRKGLDDLDRRALAASQGVTRFADLPFGQQTMVLKQVEDSGFFGTVHFLTLCGCFTLPSYGGNRDLQGWKQIGFESRHVWQPPFGYYDAEYAKEGDDAGA